MKFNTTHELQLFRLRISIVMIFVVVCFSILLARFFWLQIICYKTYFAQAEENRILMIPIVPNRGLILDRNGVILAHNYFVYTLEITPSKIKTSVDKLINALSLFVNIQPKDRQRFQKLFDESKNFESLPLLTRLSHEEVAKFTAHRYLFPGVEIQAKLLRRYPYGEIAAHLIGYIGRINAQDAMYISEAAKKINYHGTLYIGKDGLEKSYEMQLHGITGYEEVEVSASGKTVRTLSRTPAISGHNLVLSIDIELQKIIQHAFGKHKGALVAIDPSTGEILAYVSQPSFDPNIFVDGINQKSWNLLNNSLERPLINRPLSGMYSPGSIYKPFMALAALELGKRKPTDIIYDPGFFQLGRHKFHDDKRDGHGIVNMYKSIVVSCDTYYYLLAHEMGVDTIHEFMKLFGFGQISGVDLEHEKQGVLPSTAWKNNFYTKPEQRKWYSGETISLGIGQGYNSFTPLQIAQATAILANNGVVMKPHLVKLLEHSVLKARTIIFPKENYRIPLKHKNLNVIKQAMVGVNTEGSGARVFANAKYTSAGKTGTAQVISLKRNQKYNSKRMPTHLLDNALYAVFAPVEKPRIAIAVIVENGGWGAETAAPIAKKALDYYLLNKRPDV